MVNIIVARPRGAQWDEAQAASWNAGTARKAGDLEAEAFWNGAASGYMAAYSDWALWAEDYACARQRMFSVPLPLHEAQARLATLLPADEIRRRDTLRACGVLFGFKEATAECADAAECGECWNRILTERDDDAVDTSHGWFCDDDCHRAFDGGRCCRPEPEFDEDAYYERKYR